MFDRKQFEATKREQVTAMSKDAALKNLARDYLIAADQAGYAYQWTWLGLPIIQFPPDIIATQEIIWETKPDIIIETGIAWGGSILLYASLQQLMGKGKTIAVDLNLYDHVRDQIMGYPFSKRIQLLKGSSVEPSIVDRIKQQIEPGQSVMVLLDSSHTHEHVLAELKAYAPMVTKGQFLIVSDTIVEDIPPQTFRQRPWGPGDNPKTAMWEYLKTTDRFEEDFMINNKLLTTYTPNAFLRCIK